jgi:hypothetical protein
MALLAVGVLPLLASGNMVAPALLAARERERERERDLEFRDLES